MNFSKVKLIIILCLIIVNVIFAIICIRLISETNYISEEEAALASSNLLKNGITAEFDKEARRLYNLPVYASRITVEENSIPETYRRITESFFGVKPDNAAYVKTPEGYSISVKDSDGELQGSSSLFGNTGFDCFLGDAIEYKENPELYGMPMLEDLDDVRDSEYDIAASFVVKAFKDYNMRFVYNGSQKLADGKLLSFSGELSDTMLTDVYINVLVKEGKIVCCAGKVFDSVPEKKYSTQTIDSIDAVYLLAAYLRRDRDIAPVKELSIEEISMVYDSVEYSYGEYYIIPTWIIKCKEDDGSYVTYSVDAVTGEGIREREEKDS